MFPPDEQGAVLTRQVMETSLHQAREKFAEPYILCVSSNTLKMQVASRMEDKKER